MDGLLNTVQRAFKSVQAKLEASQAATFGKGVSGGGCLWCQFVSCASNLVSFCWGLQSTALRRLYQGTSSPVGTNLRGPQALRG